MTKRTWGLALLFVCLGIAGTTATWFHGISGGADQSSDDTARAQWIRITQREAGARYDFAVDDRDGEAVARTEIADVTFEIDGRHVSLAPADQSWRAGLELRRLGRRGALRSVPSGHARADGNEWNVDRGLANERWISGPLGVEHIVEIAARPSGSGELELELELVGDLRATLSASGDVELRDGSGTTRATYSDVFVEDARGMQVPAQLEIADSGIRIRVNDNGATYPLAVDPLVGVQQAHLFASSPAAGDLFGISTAFDGTTAVIGATFGDGVVADTGTAYVFTRDAAGAWSAPTVLMASDGLANDQFGASVALAGNTIVVGAPRADSGAVTDVGAAYVFVRSGTTWSQQARLGASDALAADRLGISVSTDGATVVAGAYLDDTAAGANAGSVYIYTVSGTTWSQAAHLFASDASAGDFYGSAVGISGGTIAVGAASDDIGTAMNAGSAYVYTGASSAWAEQAHLIRTDIDVSESLGASLSLQNDTLAVGAPLRASSQGSVAIFNRTGTTWTQGPRLVPAAALGDAVGSSVALNGNMLVTGTGAAAIPGYVAVFQLSGGTWSEAGHVVAADGLSGDGFGVSVGLSGDTVVVGAYSDDSTAGTDQGSAYAELLRNANGDSCTSGAACASGFCVDGVCCNNACAGGTTDCQACSTAAGAAANGTCAPLGASTVCRAAVAGGCDVPESCNGVATTCPADIVATNGTACRAQMGSCDVADTCNGVSPMCVDARVAAGTVCRPSTGNAVCDPAETCVAANPDCPADTATNGTSCSDGVACNGAEVCVGGACPTATPLTCGDTDACTADSCAEPGGCMHTHITGCCNTAADCDDSDGCTADSCSGVGGTCTHMPLTVCVDSGMLPDAGHDAATPGDGSVPRDAGPDSGRDTGPRPDAGDSGGIDAGTVEPAPSNCGCTTVGRTGGNPALALLGLAALVAARRRRR